MLSKIWSSVRRPVLVQLAVGGIAIAVFSGARGAGIDAQTRPAGANGEASPQAGPVQAGQTTAPAKPAASHDDFPEGPGKAELLSVCSRCHAPSLVMAKRQDRQGWEETITKMAGLGASGTDEQYTAILEYLVKNYPPSAAPTGTSTPHANR